MRSNFKFIGFLRLVLVNITIIVVTWEPKCFSCLRCNCGKRGYHLLRVHQCHVICHIESPWRGGWEGSEAFDVIRLRSLAWLGRLLEAQIYNL